MSLIKIHIYYIEVRKLILQVLHLIVIITLSGSDAHEICQNHCDCSLFLGASMNSPGESNTQYDFEPQTQVVDDYPEDEIEQTKVEDSWGQLVSRSVDGPHVNLQNIDADEQGRFNVHTLGRSAQCSLVFGSSARISNKHCMIYCKQNIADPNNPRLEAWIEDTSANGTFINGETRLTKNVPRLLHHRDEIFLVNPELKRLAKPGSKIIEDVVQNSFVIMLNLPAPVDEFVLASRDYDMQMSQNSQLSQGAFSGIARIERSSTVNRLLGQKRCIYDHYEIKSLLGEGTSGHVYHGINKETGKDWAVKIIPTKNLSLLAHATNNKGGKGGANELTKEAEMLRSLRHPHIIHLEDIFADNKRLFLVMELSSGGDLFDRIVKKKSYPEHEAKIVMTQILQAMAYLHERNIAHRDIKPENILLVNKQSDVDVKLTDFGLAKKVDESSKLKTFCGTPQYFAPEVLQRRGTVKGAGTYSLAADMWSLGVILFVLLEGNYPFNENTLSQQISSAQYSFQAPIWKRISSEAKDLIRQLLVIDPTSRLTAQQALQCKWFQQDTPVVAAVRVPTFFASVPPQLPPVPEGSSSSTTSNDHASNGHAHSAQNGDGARPESPGTAMRSEAVNTNVTNVSDSTAMVVDNGSTSTDSAEEDPTPRSDAPVADVASATTEASAAAEAEPAPTKVARSRSKKAVAIAEENNEEREDRAAPTSVLQGSLSFTSAVQVEFEKVNLNNAATPSAAPSPAVAGRKNGRKAAGSGAASTASTSSITPSTTGKRKAGVAAEASNSAAGTPSKGRGRNAAAADTSTAKKPRGMESYFQKLPATPSEADGSKRRVTRSASVQMADI